MFACLFSTLIRKLGGFFIRRKLDETPDGKKDVLYRALLHAVTRQTFCLLLAYFLGGVPNCVDICTNIIAFEFFSPSIMHHTDVSHLPEPLKMPS